MRIMRVWKAVWVCDTSTRININILHVVYALKAAYNCDKWGASACIIFPFIKVIVLPVLHVEK